MKVKTFNVGPFQMNCYLVSDGTQADCILIDPGDDIGRILQYIDEQGLNPLALLATHGHLDHVRFLAHMQEKSGAPFYMGAEDLPLLEALEGQARMFNLPAAPAPRVDVFLQETTRLQVGTLEVRFLHTPGHSPGSYSFLINDHLFAGDVLFKDSIGRSDLYGGDYNILMHTIQDKILTLPDETKVCPGHGPLTTVGREKANNPFLRAERG